MVGDQFTAVGQGRIEITQVVSEEKIEKITAVIKESDSDLVKYLFWSTTLKLSKIV
jgi:hypothetical protein